MKRTLLAIIIFIFCGTISHAQIEYPDNIVNIGCSEPATVISWDEPQIRSTAPNIAVYFPIVVGDIDANDTVDIIAAHYFDNSYWTTQLDIYDGDLNLEHTITIPEQVYCCWGAVAIARYPQGTDASSRQQEKSEYTGAIFVLCWDLKIRSYSISGELLNVSDYEAPYASTLSIADFNNDGYPEVYVANSIYDAATLKRLCTGSYGNNIGLSYRGISIESQGHQGLYAMPLAADLIGDSRLELICGNCIYDVDIVSRTDPSQNRITTQKLVTPPAGYPQDGHSIIADFDKDGQLDVLVIKDLTPDNVFDDTYLYAYNPVTGNILFSMTNPCRTIGLPSIGDIDNDNFIEMVFSNRKEDYLNNSLLIYNIFQTQDLHLCGKITLTTSLAR